MTNKCRYDGNYNKLFNTPHLVCNHKQWCCQKDCIRSEHKLGFNSISFVSECEIGKHCRYYVRGKNERKNTKV